MHTEAMVPFLPCVCLPACNSNARVAEGNVNGLTWHTTVVVILKLPLLTHQTVQLLQP